MKNPTGFSRGEYVKCLKQYFLKIGRGVGNRTSGNGMTDIRKESSTEYLSGRNAVREALEGDPTRITKVLLSEQAVEAFARDIRRLARASGIQVQTVPPGRLNRSLPGVNHQGVAALMTSLAYTDVHDLLTSAAPLVDDVRSRKPIIVLLDQIQDPHNLGAVIRSAAAAGAAGIIIPDRNAAPLNAAAVKTSAGSATLIPIARVSNLGRVIDEMKERGYWIVGADGTSETSVWEMDWDRPLGIVIGGERKGMRSSIAKACDYRVSIPIRGEVESLNASVAAGIILFAAVRGRP